MSLILGVHTLIVVGSAHGPIRSQYLVCHEVSDVAVYAIRRYDIFIYASSRSLSTTSVIIIGSYSNKLILIGRVGSYRPSAVARVRLPPPSPIIINE